MVIKQLKEKYDINFLIIAEKDPCLKEVNYTFKNGILIRK